MFMKTKPGEEKKKSLPCVLPHEHSEKSNNTRASLVTGVVVEFKMCTEKILKQKNL